MSDKIASATWRQCNETSSWIPGGVCGLILFSSVSTILKVMSDKFLPEIPWSDSLEYCAQNESTMMEAEDLFNYFPLYFTSLSPLFSLLYLCFVYLLCRVKMHLSYLGLSLKVMQEVFRTAAVCILSAIILGDDWTFLSETSKWISFKQIPGMKNCRKNN